MSKRKTRATDSDKEGPRKVSSSPSSSLTITFPPHWQPADTQLGSNRFILWPSGTVFHKTLSDMFHSQISSEYAQILAVRESRNPMLYARYKPWELQNGNDPKASMVLWHGTDIANAEQICIQNLDKGRIRSNVGSVYGMGVYLTRSIPIASSDNYSKPSKHVTVIQDPLGRESQNIVLPEGSKCMIMCRAVPGRTLPVDTSNSNLVAPPAGFDSTCNEEVVDKNTGAVVVNKECIYSIFNESRIYPAAIVYFLPIQPFRKLFKPAPGHSNTTLVFNQMPTQVVAVPASAAGASSLGPNPPPVPTSSVAGAFAAGSSAAGNSFLGPNPPPIPTSPAAGAFAAGSSAAGNSFLGPNPPPIPTFPAAGAFAAGSSSAETSFSGPNPPPIPTSPSAQDSSAAGSSFLGPNPPPIPTSPSAQGSSGAVQPVVQSVVYGIQAQDVGSAVLRASSPPPPYPYSHLAGDAKYGSLPPLWPEMEAALRSMGRTALRRF